jgi:hypothetical protein
MILMSNETDWSKVREVFRSRFLRDEVNAGTV